MIPLALFLLACATVYLGTIEAAFSAMMRLSLRLLAERETRSAAMTKYLEDPVLLYWPNRLLMALAITLTTAGFVLLVGASTPRALGLVLLTMTAFIVVCQHLLPFLIVKRDPEAVLERLLPTFHLAARVLEPVVRPLAVAGAARRERQGSYQNGDAGPDTSDAAGGSTEGGEPGVIESDERRLLRSIADFGDTLVREVMTPRPDVVAISAESTLDELRRLILEEQYSRIPVFAEGLDDIVGVIFVKDLIRLGADTAGGRALRELVRTPYFVPETKHVAELLREFQERQVQMAIVVDEYGGTAGLVTLEDLLEEIVGEIRDEYDVETEPVVEESSGVFLVSGRVDVDEVAERLGVRIEREGFETVGGYLLSHLGRVPTTGETFSVDELNVEVLEAERRRVTKVRIRRQISDPPGNQS